jgi:sugar phosphate isomerase/epimerase
MRFTSTHTFVVLELSDQSFKEIFTKLKEAGYDHAFVEEDGKVVIDMHGIAVGQSEPK